MKRRPTTTLNPLLLLLIATTAMAADPTPTHSHNITAILSQYPEFSTFNHHLTTTGLADVINNRDEVTVCALDEPSMSDLLGLHPSPPSLRRILLFNLFAHYSGPEYLESCCAWTLYPRPSGSGNEVVDQMNIDGIPSFTSPWTPLYSHLLHVVLQIPPRLTLLHVSKPLPSPEYRSLTSPVEALRNMTSAGCGEFARAVAGLPAAERWFRENAYVGMTVLCPVDAAWGRFTFTPRFAAMDEDEKVDLLLFHAIPVYHGKCSMTGEDTEWRPATLASYYRGNGGFGEPTVKMAAVRRLIVGAFDEGGPLAVYPIEGVLLPDDPVGVVDYSEPSGARKWGEEECPEPRRWRSGSFAPAPEPTVEADSVLVEDINVKADPLKGV